MNKEIALKYLRKLKITITESGCHIPNRWFGKGVKSYIKVTIDKRVYRLARLVLVAYHDVHYYNDVIVTRHTCNNPPCINQKHVIPGVQGDNILDQVAAGTHIHARKPNCPKCGSAYTTIFSSTQKNRRYCPVCNERKRTEARRKRINEAKQSNSI